MDYQEGKQRFIEIWGKMASGWGIPPTMARVHALLLASADPLTADDVVKELDISMGSANTNLRELAEWGLVYRKHINGERREYFEAERDTWAIMRQIIIHRKRKELDPVIAELEQLKQVNVHCKHSKCFKKIVEDICKVSHRADQALTVISKSDPLCLLRLLTYATQ